MDRSVAELEMAEEVQNQSLEFPLKRNRSEETREVEDEDRISRLPDSLLVEILSRLPATKCAVKTSALSKRWKHIWTSVSKLIFTHHDDPNAGFNSFVDKILSQRGQLKLKKLDICSTYNDRSESQVRNWVRYAINCNVQEINLTLWDPKSPQSFLLDQCFYINSFFTKVKVTFCDFNPVGAISWKNLLRLRLSHVDLDEDLIENILSGSPVLETLVLTECFGFTRLDITSKSVKKLVLNGFMGDDDVIEINAPNILTLKIEDDLCLRKLLLMNVSSLVEAELNYTKGGQFETTRKEAEEDMLKGLVLKLNHVKEFKIGIFSFKVLCRLVAKGFIFPSNLKVSNVRYDPFESDSDSDESKDSEVLLLDDGSEGDDELQE